MATLTKSPKDFFETTLYENKKTNRVKTIKTLNNEQVIIHDLRAGTTLTKASHKHSKSIGYLKQLALRHGIKVIEKPSKINCVVKRGGGCFRTDETTYGIYLHILLTFLRAERCNTMQDTIGSRKHSSTGTRTTQEEVLYSARFFSFERPWNESNTPI